MYDVNDILTRLQNGESAESLAKDFTEALNAASKEFEAKAAAEAKAKAVERANAQKVIHIKDICATFASYIKEFHPNNKTLVDMDLNDLSNEEYLQLAKTIDTYIELLDNPFISIFGTAPLVNAASPAEIKAAIKPTVRAVTEEELDKVFDSFFKKMKI